MKFSRGIFTGEQRPDLGLALPREFFAALRRRFGRRDDPTSHVSLEALVQRGRFRPIRVPRCSKANAIRILSSRQHRMGDVSTLLSFFTRGVVDLSNLFVMGGAGGGSDFFSQFTALDPHAYSC
jgi:hypothetical protein